MHISDSDDYDDEDTISGDDGFGFGQLGMMGMTGFE